MGEGQLEITFAPIDDENIEHLKTLNRAIFPVNYPDRVYQDILACGDVTQLALSKGTLLGAIACRLENSPQVPTQKSNIVTHKYTAYLNSFNIILYLYAGS